jgi:hypothetical protein
MAITTLKDLLARAGINASAFWMDTWFRGCALTKNQLMCPDKATADSIARMFLPQLREAMPDIEIRVSDEPPFSAPKTGGWKAKPGPFKRGHEPSDYKQPRKDLL